MRKACWEWTVLPPGLVLTAPHEAWSPISGLSRHVAVVILALVCVGYIYEPHRRPTFARHPSTTITTKYCAVPLLRPTGTRHNNVIMTSSRRRFDVIMTLFLRRVPARRSQFFPKSSRQTPHSSTVRTRYDVSAVSTNFDLCSALVLYDPYGTAL